jgi:hypothetical protein
VPVFLEPHRCALRKDFVVRLHVWQTASAKRATAQEEITSPLAENKRAHKVSYFFFVRGKNT